MGMLSRVVWSEGMHLSQHHFQLQSRYFEESASFALSSLFFGGYGVSELSLDPDALLGGSVFLRRARGIMPDGLPFDIPGGDPAPDPLVLKGRLSPDRERHLVYLTIPPFRPGGVNCLSGEEGEGPRTTASAPDARFRMVTVSATDEVSGVDEQSVALGRKNFRLAVEGEELGDRVALPVARLRRDGAGDILFDSAYIPPLLQLRGSERLVEIVARLVEMLESRAVALSEERMAADAQGGDAREMVALWLSHAVHSSLAPLRHHLEGKRGHPEVLYQELARLAGALCTFTLDTEPGAVPRYDHEGLDLTFGGLERMIRQGLQVVAPTSRIVVPLTAPRPLLHTGSVTDPRAFKGGSAWYLAVRSSLPMAELAAQVPRLLKVCSAKHIVRLVKEGLPGIGLEHVAAPPGGLTPDPGVQYFLMDRNEPCWASVRDSGEVGVYVPQSVADAALEVVILLPERDTAPS